MGKLTEFELLGQRLPVTFIATETVKTGVSCDTYSFDFDDSRDLAIVHVYPGFTTPLQRVAAGTKTIEGYVSGVGTLTVLDNEDKTIKYAFQPSENKPIHIQIGEIMQWQADKNSALTFYEICEPRFQEGRFETLPG